MSLSSSLSKKNSSSLDEKEVFVALESEVSESGSLLELELLESDESEDTLESLLDDGADESSKESDDNKESESLEKSSECSIFNCRKQQETACQKNQLTESLLKTKLPIYHATSPIP